MILSINSDKKAEALKALYDYAKFDTYAFFDINSFYGLHFTVNDANATLAYHNDVKLFFIDQIKGVPLDLIFHQDSAKIDVGGFDFIYGKGIAHQILQNNALLAGLSGLLSYNPEEDFTTQVINAIQKLAATYKNIKLIHLADGRLFAESNSKRTILLLATQLSCFDLKIVIKKNHFFPTVNRFEITMPEAPAQSLTPQAECQ